MRVTSLVNRVHARHNKRQRQELFVDISSHSYRQSSPPATAATTNKAEHLV